jgi:hypothetical protein
MSHSNNETTFIAICEYYYTAHIIFITGVEETLFT